MLDTIALHYQKYAPLFLRFTLAVVFFLFGIQKLANPGQSTSEIQLLLNFELEDAAALSYYMGLTEILIATTFILGYKVRIFSLLASFLIASIFFSFLATYGLSINPDLYRDIGLLGAALTLFFLGAGPIGLDQPRK